MTTLVELTLWHVLLWIATAAYIAASVTYGVLAPWYRSHTGRRLMFTMASTAVSLCMISVYVLHAYGDTNLELCIIYGMFFISGLGMCGAFLHQQLRSKKVEKEPSLREPDLPKL